MSTEILEIKHNREKFLDLLLLADPEEAVVLAYLNQGWLFALYEDGELYGVMHLIEHDARTLEIKNLAVKESAHGKGYGMRLINQAKVFGKQQGYRTLLVGTGNSGAGIFTFYQKAGFRFKSVIRDFFVVNYKEPIFENGLQCRDMVLLDQELD
ncbi:MAG: gcn5-related n-acetyltransferase [Chloroflexi bacterium]|jgi:aminoglycoside 6'-N-acetyltransferase I|nr:gcn5-related n-acetyltransferase [Chloroflexota bacterium]